MNLLIQDIEMTQRTIKSALADFITSHPEVKVVSVWVDTNPPEVRISVTPARHAVEAPTPN